MAQLSTSVALPTETPELLSQLEACQKQVRALFGEVRTGGYLDANEYLAHRLAPDYIATLENFGQLVLGAVGNHMAIATTVPAPPAPHSFLTMTLPAWKLDLTDSGLPRGSPAFPYVADAAQRSFARCHQNHDSAVLPAARCQHAVGGSEERRRTAEHHHAPAGGRIGS